LNIIQRLQGQVGVASEAFAAAKAGRSFCSLSGTTKELAEQIGVATEAFAAAKAGR
jgi:hypothetical protein